MWAARWTAASASGVHVILKARCRVSTKAGVAGNWLFVMVASCGARDGSGKARGPQMPVAWGVSAGVRIGGAGGMADEWELRMLDGLRRLAPRGLRNFGGGLLLGAAVVTLAFVYSDKVMEALVRAR